MLIEQKAANLDVEDLNEETGKIVGYGAIFGGEPDSYGDIIQAGAFANSLAKHSAGGTKPKMFWQHNPSEVIGRWESATEDAKGLRVEGFLNMNVQRGREAYALLKAGDIDGLSIGYRTVKCDANGAEGIRTLLEVDLYEVSVVSIGAKSSALVDGVKSAREISELKQRLADGGRLTEREFEKLLKGTLGLSNSQAERAARIHLKGRGDPAAADHSNQNQVKAFLNAMLDEKK